MTVAMPADAGVDLARLESLLAQKPLGGEPMPLDAIHGMLCALALGPDDGDLGELWLGLALGAEELPADAIDASETEVTQSLRQFREQTYAQARAGRLAPLLYEKRRGRPDYETWCRGFLDGVEFSDPDWYEIADADEVDELLLPIRVLGNALSDEERNAFAPAEFRKRVLGYEATFDEAIERIRSYWAILLAPPETIRREGPKVGRNDPCPCGSGRKYKHCHGG